MARDPSDPYYFEAPRKVSEGRPRGPILTVFTLILLAFVAIAGLQIGQTISQNAQCDERGDCVGAGDPVTVDYEARDAATGRLVDTTLLEVADQAAEEEGFLVREDAPFQPVTFAVGSGESDLGASFEQRLVGTTPGQTLRFTVSAAEGPGVYERTVEIPRTDGPYPFEPTTTLGPQDGLDLATLEQRMGPLANGSTVDLPWEPTPWPQQIVNIDRSTGDLTYRHALESGYTFEVALFQGHVEVVLNAAGDAVTYRLHPEVGARFGIVLLQGGTPLGLEPGSYRVDEVRADSILMSWSPAENPTLAGLDLRYTVHIRSFEDVGGST